MGFLSVYRAVYHYAPQAEGELAIDEGDILYVLDKDGDDGWWRVKRKAGAGEDDEPEGLVPHNYIEPAPILNQARAIYEYTRQTDEEISFPEEALLRIFDASDPDWILAGLDNEYGFVPSNYVDMKGIYADAEGLPPDAAAISERMQSLPSHSMEGTSSNTHLDSTMASPAATLAGVMQGRAPPKPRPSSPLAQSTEPFRQGSQQPIADLDRKHDGLQSPPLPSRIRHRPVSEKQKHDRASDETTPCQEPRSDEPYRTPGGFHLYNINEMVSIMGKRKKMPTTLGINLKTGIILIAPERAQDEPAQEWTADRMTHYSREGKHVFMELVRPSKSVDFHAGARDTAEEIMGALGELAGAVRAEGLKEVIMAGSGCSQRMGKVLYDFVSQSVDEVTIVAGDDIVILDDSKSDEWWQIRRVKNGKEGVVPSSYIEAIGTATTQSTSRNSPLDSTMSTVEQNRLEEIRLTKEAVKSDMDQRQRSRQENRRPDSSHKANKAKPDSSKMRTWTDRSGSFSVEAQFLGLHDGKIHLHKLNGVKIAVPIAKMSFGDLECVENITGTSLDDDRPLADVKHGKSADKRRTEIGATFGKNEGSEYDWFQFFLSCEIAIGLCERYAQAFIRDSMDESVLPDVNATILRTLGLREGDIIKVMRALDAKLGRDQNATVVIGDSAAGGLFSGPGGTLRNNTRKGRPAPAVRTSNVVNAKALSSTNGPQAEVPSSALPVRGFEDDAWNVRPSRGTDQQASLGSNPVSPNTGSAASQLLAGSLKELSLLTEPLKPSKLESQGTAILSSSLGSVDLTQRQPQSSIGASPSFFSTIPSSAQSQTSSSTQALQRPAAPSTASCQTSLVAPAPPRSLSTPQTAQPAVFGPPPTGSPMTSGVYSHGPPPSRSLRDLDPYRFQQQHQPVLTGYGESQPPTVAPYSTAAHSQVQLMQPMITGIPNIRSFADNLGTTQFPPNAVHLPEYQPPFAPRASSHGQGQGNPGSVNDFLPPALEPQRIGAPALPPQLTGLTAEGHTQLLQLQKTGPAPPVRFGLNADTKKPVHQPTGRRANLAQATPENPFGF